MFKKEIIEKLAKAIGYTGDIDSLIMGINVELEHALGGTIGYNLFDIASIAKVHLDEMEDYYEAYAIYFDDIKTNEIEDKYIEDIATEIDFFGDKSALRDGIYVEVEHEVSLGWNLLDFARIAKDHLEQHGNDYYKTLYKMENNLGDNNIPGVSSIIKEGVDYNGLEHNNKTPKIKPGTPKHLSKEDLEAWKDYGYSWKDMQSAIIRNPREIKDMKIGNLVNEIKKLSEIETKELLSMLSESVDDNEKIDNERPLTDNEIEDSYFPFKIVSYSIGSPNPKNGGASSGYLELEFTNNEDRTDNYIKYSPNGKIAFDNWYPDSVYFILVDFINDKIKEGNFDKAIKADIVINEK